MSTHPYLDVASVSLCEVVNPEKGNETAFADRAALVQEHGLREKVLKDDDLGYSPAPGETPQFS